eukprot:COSAG02_NODE_9775_length_2114_cov_1.718610_2_plen_563_part_00
MSELTSVVASRTDLIEDYSHIRSLGEALSGSKVKTYGFANCNFNAVSLATFVESVRWADATVARLKLSGSMRGTQPGDCVEIYSKSASRWVDGKVETMDLEAGTMRVEYKNDKGNPVQKVLKMDSEHVKSSRDGNFKKLTEGLKTSQVTEVDFSSCNFGPVDLGHLSEWVREATAALNSVTIDSTGVPKLPQRMDGYEESSPRTYTLTTTEENINLSKKNLGPADVALVAAWLQRPEVSSAVKKVTLSKNFLFGSKLQFGDTVHDIDADQTGWSSLCESFKGSAIEELILCDVGMGVNGVASLADAIKFMASEALTSMNCLANNFGDDDLATLLTALEGTSVRSLCGLTEGQTNADFSNKNLKPIDCKIIAAEFEFQGFIAALNSLTLDSNSIFGIIPRYDGDSNAKPDNFVDECDAFLAALKESKILTLSLEKTGIGPLTLRKLATSLPAAVARLILDENPLTGGRRNSDFDKDLSGVTSLFDTLKTSSVTELGLAKCRLGPGSLGKLCEYVRDAKAALARLTLKENRGIGASGADPLMESICSTRNTCIVSIEHDVGALV